MPNIILKLSDEETDRDFYLLWSTITDAPVSRGLPIHEFSDFYNNEYWEPGIPLLDERLLRVEQFGSSAHDKPTVEELVWSNRAGANEKQLSYRELLAQYCY